MNFIKENSGVVALVILAIMGVLNLAGGSAHLAGSSTACTDGYTCFTNLEIQGIALVDGATTLAAATVSSLVDSGTAKIAGVLSVATTSPSSLGNVVISGSGTTTLMLGSSSGSTGTCFQVLNSVGALTAIVVNGTTISAVAGSCK